MVLPYYLGCPSWSENAWRDYLYPQDAKSTDFLKLYSQVFNAVEGNTTFYASPSAATVQRWAEIMPEHFRFTAKFPGDISHNGDLRERLTATETFLQLLSPWAGVSRRTGCNCPRPSPRIGCRNWRGSSTPCSAPWPWRSVTMSSLPRATLNDASIACCSIAASNVSASILGRY